MLALSVRQPWAWAIIHAGKDIENRTWRTNYRGPLLIHASQTIDVKGYRWLIDQHWLRLPDPEQLQTGGIIGYVELIDCVTESSSRWFFGPYGFVFTQPIASVFCPLKGKPGLFHAYEQEDPMHPWALNRPPDRIW